MNGPDELGKYTDELFTLMSEELKLSKLDLMIEYIRMGDIATQMCLANNNYEPIMLEEELAIYYRCAEKVFDKYTEEKKSPFPKMNLDSYSPGKEDCCPYHPKKSMVEHYKNNKHIKINK